MTDARTRGPTPRRRVSIEKRVVTAALATSLAVLAVASAAFFALQWAAELDGLRREQRAVALTALHAAPSATPADAARLLTLLQAAPALTRARIEDAAGGLRAGRSYAAEASDPGPEDAFALPDGGRLVLTGGGARPSRLVPQVLSVCAALFFMAAGVALFLGRAFARRVIEPLNRLAAFMADVTGRAGLGRRAAASGVLEVDRLTDDFNGLLQRLDDNDAALRLTLAELTRARDAAQTASVMKSQFLANMSHEIRTPLNGVLAMTEVMALGELAPDQRERLRVVRESGEALLAVLNDVLDVSKIEAGRLELEQNDFDLPTLVRSACEAFGAALEEKRLAFELRIAPAAEGWRRGDAVRLRQVLVNLLSNAVKFTERGTVAVRLDVLPSDPARGILLEVTDTGPGMSQTQLAHVFEAFTQGDASTTRRFGGTGLGLAICRELVELMDGELTVESRPGEGSVFRVAIPLLRATRTVDTETAPEAAGAEPAAERPLRVLAAEDNLTNQQVLETIMGVFGVDLDVVGDGREAVVAWRKGAYDLVLMDVQMPEMDGLEAARTIRAAEAADGLVRTPIIALSANAMTHQVRDYLAAGMDDHVAKPIELARLQAAILRSQGRRPAAEAA